MTARQTALRVDLRKKRKNLVNVTGVQTMKGIEEEGTKFVYTYCFLGIHTYCPFRRDDYHQVGRRYWDDEDEQDQDARRRPMEERNRRGSQQNDKEELQRKQDEPALKRKAKVDDLITTRTGGAYIPPAKLRMMQAEVTDKNSVAFQRLAWEALKKSIHGLINKVNTSNIKAIISSLIRENLIRGRGLLCRSIIQAQAASPTFTNVYAALVSVINSKVISHTSFMCHYSYFWFLL